MRNSKSKASSQQWSLSARTSATNSAVFGLHCGPVEGFVGQRLHVEAPQRVGVADGLDQVVEQVELAAGEVVAGELGRVVVGAVVGAEEPGVDGAEMANRRFGG